MTEYFTTPQGRRLAFMRNPATAAGAPGIIFLGGFRSDMTGSKAAYLHQWAEARGRAFLRFDYSGHGQSSGDFLDGCIGDWAEDAAAMLATTTGPQIVVGSSMGGWIALLLARRHPERLAGLIGIAAAPDFTADLMEAAFTPSETAAMAATGRVEQPSEYSDDPYVITRRLIEDGRQHLVLQSPLPLTCPARFLQGTDDVDVPPSVALRLLDHATGPDIRLTLVKGADHRFSSETCLALLGDTLAAMPVQAAG